MWYFENKRKETPVNSTKINADISSYENLKRVETYVPNETEMTRVSPTVETVPGNQNEPENINDAIEDAFKEINL